jgi:hypothetical protein
VHPALKILQAREPSTLRLLAPGREGLGLLGTPERAARPSWLAPDFSPQIIIEQPHGGRPQDPVKPGASSAADFLDSDGMPYWIQAAIRMGTKFLRVAAGGVPPAAAGFHPSDFHPEPGCCQECGCCHEPLVEEYYFWLVGSQLYDPLDQDEHYDPQQQISLFWHDPEKLPTLLDRQSGPAARLAWCRVHNGEFRQPRVSHAAVELPPENSYFDLDSLTDLVPHANYTAREGGDALRQAARASARKKLPGNGWSYLDLRKDFPDVWELFRRPRQRCESERHLTLQITRRLFPFLPGDPALKITRLGPLFETREECDRSSHERGGCACTHENIAASHLAEVTVDHPDVERGAFDEVEMQCVSVPGSPQLYYGVGDVRLGPIDRCHDCHSLTLSFEDLRCDLNRAFLLCRYEVIDDCCGTKGKGHGNGKHR